LFLRGRAEANTQHSRITSLNPLENAAR
jgi:hypothetical protein